MALRGRPWRTLFAGGRRTPWINGGLAVLLVVAVVLAFTVIGNPSTPAAPVRTAVVTRGDVTATVTGSGNAASQASVPASFATDGTVTAVDVKAGDTVTAGQVLGNFGAGPNAMNNADIPITIATPQTIVVTIMITTSGLRFSISHFLSKLSIE